MPGTCCCSENPFDEFFFDFLRRGYGEKLPAESKAIFDQILSHCRMSKVDLENPETRRQHLSFDIPEWIRATYPVDLTPFMLTTPVEYTYALDAGDVGGGPSHQATA